MLHAKNYGIQSCLRLSGNLPGLGRGWGRRSDRVLIAASSLAQWQSRWTRLETNARLFPARGEDWCVSPGWLIPAPWRLRVREPEKSQLVKKGAKESVSASRPCVLKLNTTETTTHSGPQNEFTFNLQPKPHVRFPAASLPRRRRPSVTVALLCTTTATTTSPPHSSASVLC